MKLPALKIMTCVFIITGAHASFAQAADKTNGRFMQGREGVHASFTQATDSNTAYDLNDPRNPDCPCHKLQKQAEEEYARQHKSMQEAHPADSVVQAVRTGQGNAVSKGGSVNEPSVKKKKKKYKRWNDLRFRFGKKMSITKKTHPDYSVCYRW